MHTQCCTSRKSHRTEKGVICINEACDNYLGSTSLKRDLRKWKNPVALSVLAFHLLFSFDDFSMENKEVITYSLQRPAEETPLTIANLQKELETKKIICAREVLAQIKLESGNLNSALLKRTNNMLGMRYPFSRATAACGLYIPSADTIVYGTQTELKKYRKTENYAVYNCWQDAVADYQLWQEKCFKVRERYLNFLGDVYAEDTLYVKKIKRVAALH